MSDVNTEQQSNVDAVDTLPSLDDAISAAFAKHGEADSFNESNDANVVQEANSINGPARDEHGRFAKNGEPEAEGGEAPPTVEGGEVAEQLAEDAQLQPASPAPPTSWSVAAKAEFDKLPDAVKADIVKREEEVKQGFSKLRELKEIEPFQQLAAQYGTTVAGALNNYVAAEQMLNSDPVKGIAWLIQQYRPDLNQLSAAIGIQQGNRTPEQPNPTDYVVQELHALKRQIHQREQQEQANRTASLSSEVETFAAKPEHRYFENVRPHMAVLMNAGSASTLSEAYEMACWANPEVRAQLQKDHLAKQEAERLAKSRQAAHEAKRSAGSITGSPMPGGSSAGTRQAPPSIDEAIAAAMAKQQARA